MEKRKLLIVSTSRVHGSAYLEYIKEEVKRHFEGCKKLLFIPFARPGGLTHTDYTRKVRNVFEPLGIEVRGAHRFKSADEACVWADGIFTGGGNTFVLLNELYHRGYLDAVRRAVKSGKPYMGSSAGSNIAGMSVSTTNDMPIVYPPSFQALQLVPFNINPHYLDSDPDSSHMGETREQRINEFHFFNSQPVVGLREGTALRVDGKKISVYGVLNVRLFEKGKPARELKPDADLSFLLEGEKAE